MAKRSPHFHNVPTVSIKSNYIVDGNLDLNGVLKLTGKLIINGEEVIPGAGGDINVIAGDGIDIDGSKISINKDYVEAIVEKTIKDTDSKVENLTSEITIINSVVENLSERINEIEQNGTPGKVLEEKVEILENTLKDLETNIEGFVSKDELSEAVEEISNRIDSLAHFTVRVESGLPETLIENSIYLIPSGDDEDVYIEYIAYKNSDDEIVAELIGSTKIDLSDYVTKDQLANLVTKEEIENFVTSASLEEIESKINTLETSTSVSFVSVSSEIENIKGRLTALEEANSENPETPSLDEYVKTEELEGILEDYAKKETVASLSSKVSVNEAKINSLIARVTALEENSSDTPPESGDEEPEISGFEYGKSYVSLGDLMDDISNLEDGKIYSVTDKNTIEEYILKDGEVVQVSGGFNMQVSGDIEDTTAVSPMRDKIDANGEIMYNMPELVNGDFLFKGCDNLKVFVSDTPSLITARQMFYKCVNLETFCGVLSLLEDGSGMFEGCKLDEESILNIVDSINDFGQDGETRIITIGYNPDSIIDGSIEDYTEEFSQKGWTVEWDPIS